MAELCLGSKPLHRLSGENLQDRLAVAVTSRADALVLIGVGEALAG